ncbi:AMP-binding protein [Burkholderia pseudomallei]|uniref:AMP-binding protein n=1 Tax=Burkholderia pseudomallei TaxID=28450 RepID=UPI0022EB4BD3|nr:AMP-binding protein [Burkholderia pseudomallei]
MRNSIACANRFAHYLRGRGVRAGHARGTVCAGRGVEMLIGMLAILKAGGAYVPLDPGYPSERLTRDVARQRARRSCWRDAAGRTALDALERCAADPGSACGCVDAGARSRRRNPQRCRSHEPDVGRHLAYVIYTSGSTGAAEGGDGRARKRGESDGVRWTRRSRTRRIRACGACFPNASIAFDASVEEFWATLSRRRDARGACRSVRWRMPRRSCALCGRAADRSRRFARAVFWPTRP